jgi:hypothetical protein
MHGDVPFYCVEAHTLICLTHLQLLINLIRQHVRAHDTNVFVYELIHVYRILVCVECAQKTRVHLIIAPAFFYMPFVYAPGNHANTPMLDGVKGAFF